MENLSRLIGPALILLAAIVVVSSIASAAKSGIDNLTNSLHSTTEVRR